MPITVISPVTQQALFEVETLTSSQIDTAVADAAEGFNTWRAVPVADRVKILTRFCELFEAKADQVADTLVTQMGRPKRYGAGEVKGVLERAGYMISVAQEALADEIIQNDSSVQRYLKKEPLGPVFIIAAWNYPYLTMGKTKIKKKEEAKATL